MEAAFFGDLALNDHKSLDEAVHLVVGGSLCLYTRGVEVEVDLRSLRSSEELMNENLSE